MVERLLEFKSVTDYLVNSLFVNRSPQEATDDSDASASRAGSSTTPSSQKHNQFSYALIDACTDSWGLFPTVLSWRWVTWWHELMSSLTVTSLDVVSLCEVRYIHYLLRVDLSKGTKARRPLIVEICRDEYNFISSWVQLWCVTVDR